MSFWVYMLHCYGGAFYVGHTDDIEHRINQHQAGEIAGFTRDRRPLKLVWSEQFSTRIEALEMERKLKGWSRTKKMALIRGDWETIARLAKGRKNSPSTSSGRTDV
ncbi:MULTISPECIES: GIY-YIG nuclease family protein [unclassified Sphingobium]|uniref:GIY-YIG nuclease family protein n=1 Tax=unclassified Sphingobium TaxID=2611147 RepID=UPI0022247CF7|nr:MULTISPECIES: GIY-YIG nuclease family protein [unclassified Sphingobium]MCW2382961.1 putative GIY-YIG superfamily endonuclease [Sphingobium sp. B2D3B]MCW2400063.1 putative GIY-YIG superfamily endonuclease [Sphingobium sp. B2D3C]